MRWYRFRSVSLAESAGLLAVLAVLALYFGLKSENFFTANTFAMLMNQMPGLTVIAVGMTFVLIVGGIDLSVGSVMALSGAALGVAMVDHGWPLGVAAVLSMAMGAGCGLINGAISVVWRVPSFIVTLGMLEVARGVTWFMLDSKTKYIGSRVAALSTPLPMLGLSTAVLLSLGLVLAGHILLTHTAFGRHALASGANEETARLSGIRPGLVKVWVFVLLGALTGLAGAVNCSRLETADPNAGTGLELSAIAAVVIGGTSLMGGRGSVINTFLGVLIISVLQVGLAHAGASDPSKRVVTGLVIAVAVLYDAYRQRRATR